MNHARIYFISFFFKQSFRVLHVNPKVVKRLAHAKKQITNAFVQSSGFPRVMGFLTNAHVIRI